jgi:hypothetical protein
MSVGTHDAELVLDGMVVGTVHVHGSDASWSWGEFEPLAAFSRFAPLFGLWSLMIHADDDRDRQSDAASDELRQAEKEIDLLRAELRWTARNERVSLEQLNIDGKLIEWKNRT